MKICVLQPSYRDSASALRELDPPRDLTELLPEHEVEHVFLDRATSVARLAELRADVFVNLCDGAAGEDIPGVEVVEALERRGAAFTGAGSAFYDPSREEMKRVCRAHGVRTPDHVFAYDAHGIEEAARRLALPAFVKPRHGYSSVGVTPASRVTTIEALRAQAAFTIAAFGGALIEEYVDGREFCALVASEPSGGEVLYQPVECVFAPGLGFKTFDYKWRSSKNPWIPCTDPAIARALAEMTRTVYRALGGNGYARSDIRMDAEGRLYFLELNPNCGVFYPDHDGGTADIILALDGHKKGAFLRGLIAHAIARQRAAREIVATP